MGIGERIVKIVETHQERKRKAAQGPYGDFYRANGNELLYELPVRTGSLVIDAGGYEGEWTAKMIARYGCRSEIFEPFPMYAQKLQDLFTKNQLVRVHAAGIGGSSRTATFSFAANGTSEFLDVRDADFALDAPVIDVARFFEELQGEQIACLKLNIEGGEYEVLERLLDENLVTRCDSLLIQFHCGPVDYKQRLKNIEARLQATHLREWSYPMVWEKWVLTL